MTELVVWVVELGAVAAVAIACVRLFRAPSEADRVVALDVVFSATIALTAAMAMASGWPLFLDLGLGLAAVGFVATLVWARLIDKSPRGDA